MIWSGDLVPVWKEQTQHDFLLHPIDDPVPHDSGRAYSLPVEMMDGCSLLETKAAVS